MKHNYIKSLGLIMSLIGFVIHSQAQSSFVKMIYENFESRPDSVNIKSLGIGYEVFGDNGKVPVVVVGHADGEGNGGSNKFAVSDSLGTNGQFHMNYTLKAGLTYRFSLAVKCEPTFYNEASTATPKPTPPTNHKPVQVMNTVTNYFNPAVEAGTGNWKTSTHEFTVVEGREVVKFQSYRFGAFEYLFDDWTIEVEGYEWDGSESSDWNTASNWVDNVVPPSGSNVVIPDVANDPVISGINVELDFMEIQDGANVKIDTDASLTLNGDLTATTGYLEVMSGGSLLNKGRVGGSQHIIHRQTRFADGRYSMVGSPVQYGRVSDLGSLVYSYSESVPYNSTVDNDETGDNGLARFVERTVGTDTLKPGRGYFSAYTDMMTFTGKPNTGYIELDLTYTENDNEGALPDENNYEGFNLLANPYTASIDVDVFLDLNTNNWTTIEAAIWIWDDNGSNTQRGTNSDYVAINSLGEVGTQSTAASGGWDGYIRSGQGFFVRALADAGKFVGFNNNQRVITNGDDAGFYRKSEKPAYQTLKLNISGGDLYNETLIGFAENSTIDIDKLDAQKIDPIGSLKIYTLVDNRPLAIQALPKDIDEVEIQLGMSVESAGTYQIALGELTNWNNEYAVILHDDLLGKSIVLDNKSGIYSFNAESGTSTRFRLTLTSSVLRADLLATDFEIVASLEGLKISSNEMKGQSMEVTISDITGRKLFATQLEHSGVETNVAYSFSLNKIYIIAVKSSENTSVSKILIK